MRPAMPTRRRRADGMPGGAAAPERPRNGVYARPKASILADMKTFIHNAKRSICSRMEVEVSDTVCMPEADAGNASKPPCTEAGGPGLLQHFSYFESCWLSRSLRPSASGPSTAAGRPRPQRTRRWCGRRRRRRRGRNRLLRDLTNSPRHRIACKATVLPLHCTQPEEFFAQLTT